MNVTNAARVLGVIAVLCIGIWLGGHPGELPGFARDTLVANAHDSVISEALSDIQHDYYHPVARTGLINGAIAGAVSTLGDPYAGYETPTQYNDFNNPQPSRFSGVGIDVGPARAGLLIESVLAGAPAARAGIRPGDVITAVDGRRLAGLGLAAATALIHGPDGTRVRLTIARGGRSFDVTLTRREIAEPTVLDALTTYRGVRVGVIQLPTFDIPGIHAQVANDLQSLLHQHIGAVILDLRDDGGGLVTEAQFVASLFISHGAIVTTRGRTQAPQTIYATGHPLAPSLPMAVLVNANTASAAEIVTGALQDHHRAVIVGTRTYGKGVFQEIRPLSNGGALDITVGQYFLPNGENLGAGGLRRGAGIKPDIVVTQGPTATTDPQLAAALANVVSRAR